MYFIFTFPRIKYTLTHINTSCKKKKLKKMESHYNFERLASKICDFICTFKREIQDTPTVLGPSPINKNLSFHEELGKDIPEDGECFENVLEDFKTKIVPSVVASSHPFNFSEFPSSNSFATVIGETLTSAFGGLTFSWKTNPSFAELESLTLDWYARLLDLPPCFMFDKSNNTGGGCFHETNSDVLHNVILAARHQYIEHYKKKKYDQEENDWRGKVVVYASEDCCPILKKWCHAEFITLHLVEANNDGVMTALSLKRAMDLDHDIGMKPILVVATLGTLSKFAFDEIERIGKLLKSFLPCWLHIDGSYGGNSLLLKRYSGKQKFLHVADSVAVSPNQWLQVGSDCIALWIKNIEKYQDCFKIPSYTNFDNDQLYNALDFKHYGITTIRRTKVLSVWITLKLYGRKGLEKRLRKCVELADKFSQLLKGNSSVEVLQKRFTFVNFILKNKDNATNEKFFKYLLETKNLILTSIKLNGRFTIRFSVTYEHEREKHIASVVEMIHDAVREFLQLM